MSDQSSNIGCFSILLNVFLVFITGGLWLIVLIVKYLLSNSR